MTERQLFVTWCKVSLRSDCNPQPAQCRQCFDLNKQIKDFKIKFARVAHQCVAVLWLQPLHVLFPFEDARVQIAQLQNMKIALGLMKSAMTNQISLSKKLNRERLPGTEIKSVPSNLPSPGQPGPEDPYPNSRELPWRNLRSCPDMGREREVTKHSEKMKRR